MNSAVIKESSGKAVEEINIPGLCTVLLEHKVKETAASFNWSGLTINPLEWAKMMAFFEWTYETEKSESQVRWYAHPTEGWRCWAFPQKGGTGMTTKEIADHPIALEQRKQFPSREGWCYFMTVHHHCSAGAFQSPTDEADEKAVDGLHLTIGHMDKPERDLHARMYIRGHKFEPRMNYFWDVGQATYEAAQKCYELFGYLPSVELDKLARKRMSQEHKLLLPDWSLEKHGDKFPPQWKENYIIERPVVRKTDYWQPGQSSTDYISQRQWCYTCQKMTDHAPMNCPQRTGQTTEVNESPKKKGKSKGGAFIPQKKDSDFMCATTLKDIIQQLAVMGYDEKDVEDYLAEAFDGQNAQCNLVVYSELSDAGIELEEMAEFYLNLKQVREERAIQKELHQSVQEQQAPPQQAVTGWEGYMGD